MSTLPAQPNQLVFEDMPQDLHNALTAILAKDERFSVETPDIVFVQQIIRKVNELDTKFDRLLDLLAAGAQASSNQKTAQDHTHIQVQQQPQEQSQPKQQLVFKSDLK